MEDAERPTRRMFAAMAAIGGAAWLIATVLHPGHDPGDLAATLPEYATDGSWLAKHMVQLLGMSVLIGAVVAMSRPLVANSPVGEELMRLASGAAVVAVAVYAVNQAVDAVGIAHVADEFVAAGANEAPDALSRAESVRHIEIGTSAVFEVVLGSAFLTLGIGIARARTAPRWLSLLGVTAGLGLAVMGGATAARGFEISVSALASVVTLLFGAWVLGLVVVALREPPELRRMTR